MKIEIKKKIKEKIVTLKLINIKKEKVTVRINNSLINDKK